MKGGASMTTKFDFALLDDPTLKELLARPDVLRALRQLTAVTNELMTPEGVTELLSIHRRTLDLYIAKGILKPFRIRGSRLLRFRRQDVLNLLESTGK
jgi:excisionase family DNA binding protein